MISRRKLVIAISSLVIGLGVVFGGLVLMHRSNQVSSETTQPTNRTEPSSTVMDPAIEALGKLSLKQQVGQLFVSGFGGKIPDANINSFLKLNNFGGVILFGNNIQDADQLKTLTKSLSTLSKHKSFSSNVGKTGGF